MPTSEASSTVSAEKEAVHAVPERIIAAWAAGDADAFAAAFTEDATLILPGGVFLYGRDKIRTFMAAGYAGPFKGMRVRGEPVAGKFFGTDACLLITEGGMLTPGETEVAPKRAVRATWNLVKRDGEWLITAYQNTPAGTG